MGSEEEDPEKLPGEEQMSADQLNELARLYPWATFRQHELVRMTRLPREAVSAAFDSPDLPSQYGRSRPEDVFTWVRSQDFKAQTKQLKAQAAKPKGAN